jgi:thiamine-phosphate pyrophosphorylase
LQKPDNIARILDANINRAKEGLRVCEEIARFILEDKNVTSRIKTIRHRLHTLSAKLFKTVILLESRNSPSDIGRDIYASELERKNISDIFFANIQRVKESIRVLEEFAKIVNRNCTIALKRLRYEIYDIEKKTVKKIAALSNPR